MIAPDIQRYSKIFKDIQRYLKYLPLLNGRYLKTVIIEEKHHL